MANGTTGPGSPPIAADAYDHTGNVFLDGLVAWGWLDVSGDRNITYYFDETRPITCGPHLSADKSPYG